MIWNCLKILTSHVFADFGTQSYNVATKKNFSLTYRIYHILSILLVYSFSISQSTIKNKVEIVVINSVSHFIIDSFSMNKNLDQLLHLVFVAISMKRTKV